MQILWLVAAASDAHYQNVANFAYLAELHQFLLCRVDVVSKSLKLRLHQQAKRNVH